LSLLKQEVIGRLVRQLRLRSGLSARALGARTGFSPSFISQLENGLVSPSIGSMQKIAATLGVTLGEFFTAAGEGAAGTIVRARDRKRFQSDWSSADLQLLAASRRLEAVLITLEPGGRSGKHPASGHDHEEFAFVMKGPLTLTLGPNRHSLHTGDSVLLLPGELRMWENPGAGAGRLMVVTLRH
jgi:transcriptional regulator with XRE-family HTH domain